MTGVQDHAAPALANASAVAAPIPLELPVINTVLLVSSIGHAPLQSSHNPAAFRYVPDQASVDLLGKFAERLAGTYFQCSFNFDDQSDTADPGQMSWYRQLTFQNSAVSLA